MDRRIAWGLVWALVALGLAGCKFGNDTSSTYDGGLDGFAPQGPLLVASPGAQDFGTVNVGSKSATKTIVVANVGPGTTGSLSVALSGGNAFVIDSDGCTEMSLATQGSCSVSLHFAPPADGAQSATLKVTGSPGGEADVSLSGTGAGAGVLSISPAMNDFGALPVGSTSTPSMFTVTNKGTGATGAVTLALSGSDAAEFALSSDTCSGKPLASAGSCTVNVSASPTTPGTKAATLTAQAAGDNGTATASLSANGLAAVFVITPPTFDFGQVMEGAPPGTGKTFTVQNAGNMDAGTPSLAVTGPNAQDFALSQNMCTSGLGSMATCTFALTFSPSTGTSESATVTATAANTTTGQASVTGTGLAPADLTITPASQPFAPLLQGTGPSADVPFQVKNTGSVATGALAVSLGGTNADQFGLDMDTCSGQTLAAGGTCTVNAHFAPTTNGMAGGLQASLQVSGMPGGQTAATLTATALAPAHLTVTPATQPLGSVAPGTVGSDFPFMVSNVGDEPTGAIAVAISGMMMPDFGLGMDGCTGQTLSKGASCTVFAHFAPGASSRGNESATLTVSATPGGSVPVGLTGTATAPAQLAFVQPSVPEWHGVGVGVQSVPLTLTLQNLGDQPTGDIVFSMSGLNSTDFFPTAPNPCSGALQGGQSCMLQVVFQPSGVGLETATLQASSTSGGTAPLMLEGIGLWALTVTVQNDSDCGTQFVQGATVTASDGSTCSLANGESNTCTWLYSDGTMITLTESLSRGSFANFSWEGCEGTEDVGSPCSFTMTSNMSVTADFCGHGS